MFASAGIILNDFSLFVILLIITKDNQYTTETIE